MWRIRFRRAYRSSRSACQRSRSVEIWTEVSSIMRPLPRIRAMLPEALHYFQSSNWSRTQNCYHSKGRTRGGTLAEFAAIRFRPGPAWGAPLCRGWQRGQGPVPIGVLPAGTGANADLVGVCRAARVPAADPAGPVTGQPSGTPGVGDLWRGQIGRGAAQLLP